MLAFHWFSALGTSTGVNEVFKDPKFVAKMKLEMAKLQNDEALYNWLLETQGSDAPRRLAASFQATANFAGEQLKRVWHV